MENASKALLIAGAILLCILIIAIGMYIYNSAQSTIQDSMTSMSTQEIEAFNNNFESYRGAQSGSNISALVGRLIANAKTFEEEPGKIPSICMPQIVTDSAATKIGVNAMCNEAGAANTQNYIDLLTRIKNNVENKHTYYVSFQYSSSGYIDQINIGYKTSTTFTDVTASDSLN